MGNKGERERQRGKGGRGGKVSTVGESRRQSLHILLFSYFNFSIGLKYFKIKS